MGFVWIDLPLKDFGWRVLVDCYIKISPADFLARKQFRLLYHCNPFHIGTNGFGFTDDFAEITKELFNDLC